MVASGTGSATSQGPRQTLYFHPHPAVSMGISILLVQHDRMLGHMMDKYPL